MAKRKSQRPKWIGLTPKQKAVANREYKKLSKKYSAPYAKRVARGEALHKPRQATRGHKPKEHLERKRGGVGNIQRLTDKQLITILRFYAQEYNPTGIDHKGRIQGKAFEDEFQQRGMQVFISYRAAWRNLEKMWIDAGKPIRPGNYTVSEIEGFAAGLGFDDARWLFYH